MGVSVESSVVVLALFTFLTGMVIGIFLTKFMDMWKPSNRSKKSN